jgi:hypothetical protein
MNIATTGIPMRQWPSYHPSIPRYFYLTPDQSFLPVTWNRNCTVFDEIEAEGVLDTFGNNTYDINETTV